MGFFESIFGTSEEETEDVKETEVEEEEEETDEDFYGILDYKEDEDKLIDSINSLDEIQLRRLKTIMDISGWEPSFGDDADIEVFYRVIAKIKGDKKVKEDKK